MRILIVSSNESDVRWINNIIGEEGVNNADSCANSTDAIQLLSIHAYDLVLTEAFLPVLTGFDLKKLMDSFGYKIPVLFFTEKVSENTKKEAKYAGVINCFSTDNLDNQLPKLIEELSAVNV